MLSSAHSSAICALSAPSESNASLRNLGTSSDMEAAYPNSWDVPLATLVSPLTVQPKGVNSPYCVANPTAPSC